MRWLRSWYIGWSGRYSLIFFHEMRTVVFGMVHGYGWACIFILLFFGFGQFVFWSSLLTRKLADKQALIPSLLFSALYLAGHDSLYETTYWITGAIAYTLGLGFLGIAFAFLFWQPREQWTRRIRIPALVALTVIAAGWCEVYCAIVLLLLAVAIAAQYLWMQRVDKVWIMTWLLWLVCTIVVIAAPGNYRRAEHFPHYQPIEAMVFHQLAYVADCIAYWTLNASTLGAAALLFVYGRTFRTRYPFLSKLRVWHLIVLFLLPTVTLFVGSSISFYVTETEPPPRLNNALFYFHLVLIAFNALCLGAVLDRTRPGIAQAKGASLLFLYAIIFLGLFVSPQSTFPEAASDLLFKAPDYRREQYSRLKMVREAVARGEKSICVPPIRTRPRSLYYYDMASFGRIRNDYARVFGLRELHIKKEATDDE